MQTTIDYNPIFSANASMSTSSVINSSETTPHWETDDYTRIAEAIRWLNQRYLEQPSLDDLAAHLHLSPWHMQRLFAQWAGISPKRFVQYLTIEHAKQMLRATSVLDASLDSGLSGPGRLHDLFVTVEAVTPGEYKSGGQGIEIAWGLHTGPFGDYVLAVTDRGICGLTFVDAGYDLALVHLRQRWPAARLIADSDATAPAAAAIFAQPGDDLAAPKSMHLLLKGTNFQLQVWRALLEIPTGGAVSYDHIAGRIGKPSASRAVGSAVGANNIGYLIPCHRVIRKSGVVEGYAWGKERKQAILAWESARAA